jgi:large subunit ribosomal protein L12
MEYIYASLLLHSAKKEINEENLRNILNAAGISIDEIRLKAVVAALKEVNIDEVLKSAAATPMAVPTVTVQPQQQAAQQQEAKKEEKKEEEEKKASEEEIASGLASLFG